MVMGQNVRPKNRRLLGPSTWTGPAGRHLSIAKGLKKIAQQRTKEHEGIPPTRGPKNFWGAFVDRFPFVKKNWMLISPSALDGDRKPSSKALSLFCPAL